MVAPTSAEAEPRVSPFPDPPCPLPPDLRSDIAYRRARAHSWRALALRYGYDEDALRRATENDPDYAAAEEKAWDMVTQEGQAEGMQRLRLLIDGREDDLALKASEILTKYASERERDRTRLAVERLRAETRRESDRLRAERRAAAQAEPEWVPPPEVPQPAPETAEERHARFAREHAARAAEPAAEVYLWGGKHRLGWSEGPDESDTRVRVKADWSCGVGQRRLPVFWVVPEPCPEGSLMPGEPGAPIYPI